MAFTSRLTLLCAASAALLGLASPVLAQAGTAAGASGATVQPVEPPSEGSDLQQRSAPDGCPYQKGELELIV